MRISQAAARAGLSPRQIRYYAERGVLPEADRGCGRQREFNDRDVRRLGMLRTLLTADVPLSVITRVLNGLATERDRSQVEDQLERRAVANRGTLAELSTGPVCRPIEQPDISLMFDVYVLRTRMGAAFTVALAEADLTASEYALLSLLEDLRARTVSELARLLGGSSASLSRQLAELDRRGWVRRSTDRTRRRRTVFALTREGHERFRAAVPLAAQLAADLDGRLRERGADPAIVRTVLQTLSAALASAHETSERDHPQS